MAASPNTPRPVRTPRVTYPRPSEGRDQAGIRSSRGWFLDLGRATRPCPRRKTHRSLGLWTPPPPRALCLSLRLLPHALWWTATSTSPTPSPERPWLLASFQPFRTGTTAHVPPAPGGREGHRSSDRSPPSEMLAVCWVGPEPERGMTWGLRCLHPGFRYC